MSEEKKSEGDVLCIDSITGRCFWSTQEKLHSAEKLLISYIKDNASASLNKWYNILGIEPILIIGDMMKWTRYNNFSLCLNTSMTPDKRPYISVGYKSRPDRITFEDYINS